MTSPDRPETGIILWSNADRGVAVIWCEDQKRLAYAALSADTSEDVPQGGDLVAFRSQVVGDLRLARSLRVVSRGWHPQLVEALRDTACVTETDQAVGAKVSYLRPVG
ncbi:hypothetical protein ACEYYB_13545 [Paracoccus sp. p4-l81]|uniref:hypothetical protein n=1 Tax=Paracoccus sp. p4-l81 TaxID=3342806 RepID=UPI0035B700AC